MKFQIVGKDGNPIGTVTVEGPIVTEAAAYDKMFDPIRIMKGWQRKSFYDYLEECGWNAKPIT